MSSRHSGSSRHRSHQSRSSGSEQNPDDLVEQVKNIVNLLYEVVSSRPHEWETYVPSARSAITALDHLRFFRDPSRFAEQIWIVRGLQDFAYHDADSGCIRDIAEYCQASWLRVLRNYPENVETLTGKINVFCTTDFMFQPPGTVRSGTKWCMRQWAILARFLFLQIG
jgi:hypothetical protein